MDADRIAREYYRALDTDSYAALTDLLAPGFVHVRPDRTFDGVDQFIRFMRDDRPITGTTHDISNMYYGAEGVAAIGALTRNDRTLMRFVDVFAINTDGITAIETYTDTNRS